jgi:isoleucyl-tRNA synthetase
VLQVLEDCFEVHLLEKPETVAQRDGKLLLVLDTHVDAALRMEGLAREVVSRIQNQRKALDLEYVQRIAVQYTAPDELAAAIEAHTEYIQGETLALSLTRVLNLTGEGVETSEIDDLEFSFAVERV